VYKVFRPTDENNEIKQRPIYIQSHKINVIALHTADQA